jgi:hypothetical protein
VDQVLRAVVRVVDKVRRQGGYLPIEDYGLIGDGATAALVGSDMTWDLAMPADFESAARWLQPHQLRGPMPVSADVDQHITLLQEFAALGFEELYLPHVAKDQQEFLDMFGSDVLPPLREAGRPA